MTMTTRTATITVHAQIPADPPFAEEALARLTGEIGTAAQRTGLSCRWVLSGDDGDYADGGTTP